MSPDTSLSALRHPSLFERPQLRIQLECKLRPGPSGVSTSVTLGPEVARLYVESVRAEWKPLFLLAELLRALEASRFQDPAAALREISQLALFMSAVSALPGGEFLARVVA